MTQNAQSPQRKTMTRRELFHMFRSKPHGKADEDTHNSAPSMYCSQDEENFTASSHIPHDNNTAIDTNPEHSDTYDDTHDDTHSIVEEPAPQHIFTNLPPEFASLYRQEAEKKGLTISDDAMEEASSAFLKNFWGQCP